MDRRSFAFVIVVAVLLALASGACARAPDEGWQPLWIDEWQWHHSGEAWARGVDADGRRLLPVDDGLGVRVELLNTSAAAATVRLDGADQAWQWQLASGESLDLVLDSRRSTAVFRAPPGVILGSPRAGRAVQRPRLLVFVLVDTLRADHVDSDLMPGVCDFFSDGLVWRRAVANAPWTLPSVASFFTSRPVLDLTAPEGDLIGIPQGVATWAGELQRAGFIGGAVVANYTIAVLNGFGDGFAHFRVPDGHGGAPHPDATWVVEGARQWLAAHRGEDAFLYLHLMDPHHPYRSHDDPDRVVPDLISLANRQREARTGERETLAELYAGEVAHVDRVLTPFLLELPEDAVVVLTADHGEGLGEHSCWGHGLNLYQESLAVPLMVRGPGVPRGEVEEVVQLLDLAPTILDLAGIGPAASMHGLNLLAGGSPPPAVASTFGAGPLRWSWQEGTRKVVLRMARQEGLGSEALSKMKEGRPLPSGAYSYDLESDPAEDVPGALEPEIMERVAHAFARTAGRMVPGLQLMLWGERGASGADLRVAETPQVVQAWSTAPMAVVRDSEVLSVACEDAYPLCAVAARFDTTPLHLWVLGSDAEDSPTSTGFEVPELAPPEKLDPGLALWWNPDRPLVVGGHEETMAKLRALGYIR